MLSRETPENSAKRVRFTVLGRISVLLFIVPAFWAINRFVEVVLSVLFLCYLFLMLHRTGAPFFKRENQAPFSAGGAAAEGGFYSGALHAGSFFRQLRTFTWLAPVLVLTNALFGPSPQFLGFISVAGTLQGLLISYRLFWAGMVAMVCVNSCSQDELIGGLRQVAGRRFSLIITRTIKLVPCFLDVRPVRLRNLPEMLAERIDGAVAELNSREMSGGVDIPDIAEEGFFSTGGLNTVSPANSTPPRGKERREKEGQMPLFRYEDLLLILPALVLGVIFLR